MPSFRFRERITITILWPENPKSEIRNKSKILETGFRHDFPTFWSLEHLDFGHSQSFRISDFELRICELVKVILARSLNAAV
jgi:hypothetical protein